MTAFAQLDKRAAAQGYAYQKGSTGINNPYVPQVATAAAKQPSKWWGIAEGAMDTAAGLAGLIPGVGGVINGAWQGGKSLYHLSQGNKGKAAEAAAWAAAGFVPGAALGKTVGQAALGAGRMARVGATVGKTMAPVTKAMAPIGSAVQTGRTALGATHFGQQAVRAGQAVAGSRPGAAAISAMKAAPGRTQVGFLGGGMAAGAGVIPGFSNAAPTAPTMAQPPAPLNPYQSLTHLTAATIANGGPLR